MACLKKVDLSEFDFFVVFFYSFLQVPADVHKNAKTLFLLQKKSDVYSVEIYGTEALEKTDIGDEGETYKDLKGNKKKKKTEDLKKELDLVSVAKLPLHLAGQPLPTVWMKSGEGEWMPIYYHFNRRPAALKMLTQGRICFLTLLKCARKELCRINTYNERMILA